MISQSQPALKGHEYLSAQFEQVRASLLKQQEATAMVSVHVSQENILNRGHINSSFLERTEGIRAAIDHESRFPASISRRTVEPVKQENAEPEPNTVILCPAILRYW